MSGLLLFTLFHVAVSLVAIVLGLIWLRDLLASRLAPTLTAWFLALTALTSLTGFLFPFHGLTPALVVGALSCVLLLLAALGLYRFALAGAWRAVFVVTAVLSLYLNCFVLVVQSFLKIAPLHALAPNGSEPPFALVQGAVLLAFLYAGYRAVRRFRPLMA
jgi:hypothetical protein